jgi:hypothetical protein
MKNGCTAVGWVRYEEMEGEEDHAVVGRGNGAVMAV